MSKRVQDSRLAAKFVVRLPDGLRQQVDQHATEVHTSMNSVFVLAVKQYLDGQQRQQLLLDALAQAAGTVEVADANA